MYLLKNIVIFFTLLGSVFFLVASLIGLFTAKFVTAIIFLALAILYLYAGTKVEEVKV